MVDGIERRRRKGSERAEAQARNTGYGQKHGVCPPSDKRLRWERLLTEEVRE